MAVKYTQWILIGICLMSSLCQANYLPQDSPRSGGMKDQVLIYNLNHPGYRSKSRKPWISADTKTLYFSIGDYGKEEIWMSVKSSDRWLGAHPVKELNLPGYSSHGASLNSTMDRIYFASTRPLETESVLTTIRWRLFTANKQVNGRWGKPYLLNRDAEASVQLTDIPGKMDYATFISRDDKSLYFISNRDGGFGLFDIWCSVKQENGKWSEPYNLDAAINSPDDELSGVSVTADNLMLYFASNRTDIREEGNNNWNIYCAERESEEQSWSESSVYQVEGINPEGSDMQWGVGWPSISPDGKELFYSDKGPYMWLYDDFDLFHAVESEGRFTQPANLGESVNNFLWYKDEDFLPYVSYIDATTGKPRDVMFDSVLFLALSGSSTRLNYADGQTNSDDWNHYLEMLFMPERQLDKLNSVVGEVKQKLHQGADYRMKVSVMIPYPHPRQVNFGDIDGDNASEDLTSSDNRLKVIRWYLDHFLSRWKSGQYNNLELCAMYWMNEGVYDDADLVNAVSHEVHQRGLLFEWIPYYAADYQNWGKYGFDIVQYQPNYAWLTRRNRGGHAFVERLTESANRSQKLNMAVEVEFDERPLVDGINLRAYLDFGSRELSGYMYHCLLGYYQGGYTVKSLGYASFANEPYARDAYDNLYRFIKEDYPDNLTYRKTYRYSVPPDKQFDDAGHTKLTDYSFLPDKDPDGMVVGFYQQNPSIIFDLEKQRTVEKVYAHLLGGNVDDQSFPKEMSVEISIDNQHWKKVGTTSAHRKEENAPVTGDMLVKFSPVKARYIRINFIRSAGWVKLDELQVYGK